jgi:N-acetylglucosaminyl-diphospho-decaprenol L-rhamnosyltransferase
MSRYPLSVIIVNWNTWNLLRDCVGSLNDEKGIGSEIIVVDNGSTDGSPDRLKVEFPEVLLVANRGNHGFTTASNQGIRVSQGEYVLLLNSDTWIPKGSMALLVHFMNEHPEAGACGPRLVRPDGTPQPYAFGRDPTVNYLLTRWFYRLLFHRYLHDWTTDHIQEVDWVSGACLMVRREIIDQIGLLDENFFMYFEDNDWCLRMRQHGWKIYYNPRVSVIHHGGQSLGQNPAAHRAYYRSLKYFYEKHYGPLARLLLKVSLIPYRWSCRNEHADRH